MLVGHLVYVSDEGVPFVTLPGTTAEPVEARTAVDAPGNLAFGQELRLPVLLCLERSDPPSPVIVGFVKSHFARPPAPAAEFSLSDRHGDRQIEGRTIALEARDELSLRCGEAAITIRKDGKVLVRGTEVVSSATGRNRIKGGSVEIN